VLSITISIHISAYKILIALTVATIMNFPTIPSVLNGVFFSFQWRNAAMMVSPDLQGSCASKTSSLLNFGLSLLSYRKFSSTVTPKSVAEPTWTLLFEDIVNGSFAVELELES